MFILSVQCQQYRNYNSFPEQYPSMNSMQGRFCHKIVTATKGSHGRSIKTFISVSKRGVLKKVYEFIFGKSDKQKEHKVGFREIHLPIYHPYCKILMVFHYHLYNIGYINFYMIVRLHCLWQKVCDCFHLRWFNITLTGNEFHNSLLYR